MSTISRLLHLPHVVFPYINCGKSACMKKKGNFRVYTQGRVFVLSEQVLRKTLLHGINYIFV